MIPWGVCTPLGIIAWVLYWSKRACDDSEGSVEPLGIAAWVVCHCRGHMTIPWIPCGV